MGAMNVRVVDGFDGMDKGDDGQYISKWPGVHRITSGRPPRTAYDGFEWMTDIRKQNTL